MQTWKSWWVGLSHRIRPKSNGMPVGRRTAIYIKAANAARTQQNWSQAASKYRQALAREGHLQHLWIQLGHMEKEAGVIDQATAAYEEAARLHSDDTAPLLYLGHIAKAWQQPAQAARYFIRALQRDRTNLEAISELARVMPDREMLNLETWREALSALGINPATDMPGRHQPIAANAILMDVTDLIAFFGQRRLPTGIQRVQIEISLAAMERKSDLRPVFCIYTGARRGWVRLNDNRFETLCRLAKQSDDAKDPAWTSQLKHLYRTIAVSRTIQFSRSITLINLGTSWSERNYLLDIRTARARDAIVYVPLIFDLIPLIGPDWFMQSLVRDYRAWFRSLLHSADGCLAISQATHQNLVEKSASWNVPISANSVSVVPLDGDFRQETASIDSLQSYGLEPLGYVLLVSTLEPRKNHKGAFAAWLRLIDSLDEAAVPHLVCVGGRGWLNDDIHQMLRDHPRLRRMVRILHGVPDDRLATLYEHCLFSLYPSFYEGWGLPVSEALSYGKVPAISCVSSLPEAGGSYAYYFDPYDPADIAATVRTLLDGATRGSAEAAIKQNYAPRTWQQIAQGLVAQARAVVPRTEETLPRISDAGLWPLSLSRQSDDDMLSGEPLRHGHSWLAPTMTGCGIKGDDAALWFYWSGLSDAQIHVYITATPDPAIVRVGLNGGPQEIAMKPNLPTVISLPLPDVAGPVQITMVPLSGDIIVEKIAVTRKEPL